MNDPSIALNDSSIKRVLIYRLGSLGDTVVALPALHLIARAFPAAERRMLTNVPVNAKAPAAAAILTGTGLVDGYLKYNVGTRGVLELISLWWKILCWRPQVIIYLAAFRGNSAVLRDQRFFSLCGIKRQIGVPVTLDMQENRWVPERQMWESEAGRLVRNLAELGQCPIDEPENWQLRLTAAEVAAAKKALSGAANKPLIAVSLGTKIQSNDWGAENWHGFLAALAGSFPGHALALCGVREESAACEAAAKGWRKAVPAPGDVVNLCGLLSPRETAAVFTQAKVFIGHDSGPMHLAEAVQTPCVAIFAARNKPGIWFPQSGVHRVIYHQVDCFGCGLQTCVIEKKKCISSITVDEVLKAVREVLDSR